MGIFRINTIPGQNLSKDVGFNAVSVLIDNYTSYWLYFPKADAYIPPWYSGVVLNLTNTTDYAEYQILSPFANPQLPVVASYFVHTVWADYALSPTPSPGNLIHDTVTGLVPSLQVNVTVVQNVSIGGVAIAGASAPNVTVAVNPGVPRNITIGTNFGITYTSSRLEVFVVQGVDSGVNPLNARARLFIDGILVQTTLSTQPRYEALLVQTSMSKALATALGITFVGTHTISYRLETLSAFPITLTYETDFASAEDLIFS